MSTVNLYDVLNVSQDCTRNELKDAYRQLVKEFHPDRPNGDAEMFELIRHAFEILSNPKSREEYDTLFKLSKQSESDHFNLKYQAENYIKSQKSDITTKSKKEQETSFKKAFEEMDRKRGYKRDTDAGSVIASKDADRMLKDLRLIREQEDIENIHEQLFENGRFDINKFNAAFDAMHTGPMDMVPHNGNPDAYNTIDNFGSVFSGINNYDDIFVDDEEAALGTPYSSVQFDNRKKKKITKTDIDKLQGADYTSRHNDIDADYDSLLEQRMKEYNSFSDKINNREFNDFSTDDGCGGYGILNQLGIKNMGNITWENEDDFKTSYNRLLELRESKLNRRKSNRKGTH